MSPNKPRFRLSMLLITLAAVGCATGDDLGDDLGDEPMGGAPGDGGHIAGGTGGVGGAGGASSPALFSIRFDYRFDTKGVFQQPARRAALEAAAAQWMRLIEEDFEDIPAGTAVLTRDPEHPSEPGQTFDIDQPIDDLLVFVGFASFDGPSGTLAASFPSAAIGSVSDPALSARLSVRTSGADFEPWTAWLSFDEAEDWFFDPTPDTDSDIPLSQEDFISVTLHELGHILGFGTADAFFALVDDQSRFAGAAAVAAFGGPVPLTGDAGHIAPGVLVDGQRPLMDPSDASGERSVVTSLERAIFSDLGHTITP